MKRKVTLVFHDEDLYTQLKIEAVKRRTTASDIVSDAVREWLESREDAELIPVIESARAEWKEKGGRSWAEVEQELAQTVNRNEENPQAKRV
jgi:translation elongation factor EF-Tu-like GTPase